MQARNVAFIPNAGIMAACPSGPQARICKLLSRRGASTSRKSKFFAARLREDGLSLSWRALLRRGIRRIMLLR